MNKRNTMQRSLVLEAVNNLSGNDTVRTAVPGEIGRAHV